MAWEFYGLDNIARQLIKKQTQESIKESHKMRTAVAYGLERFWGEGLRLEKEPKKAAFWKETWDKLVEILASADISIPKHNSIDPKKEELWKLTREEQQIALAVLTQLCDSLVWWTQRYKNIV
ncbi:MAG: hypothetical protein DSM106950_38020 [Stigonema ocellatum SAG 48.90 = DSM 106950]|nr:hypothetical protein [Stigonema ocellatum SAG 48.90 = DSM 106950]